MVRRSKIAALVLALLFTLTIGLGTAGAGDSPEKEAAQKIHDIYANLDEAGQEAVREARDGLEQSQIKDNLAPVFEKTEIEEDADTKDTVSALVTYLLENVFLADPGITESELEQNIANFITNYNEDVTGLLGKDVSAGDLVQFQNEVYTNITNSIKENFSDYSSAALSQDVDKLKKLLRDAYHQGEYSQAGKEVKNALEEQGLTLDILLEAWNNISSDLPPEDEVEKYEAEKALLLAYLSSIAEEDSGSVSPGGGGGGAPSTGPSGDKEKEPEPEPGEKEKGPQFTDLDDFAWAADTINTMAALDLVEGRTETEFAPAAPVTRAEFTALVMRVLDLEEPAAAVELPFKDVPGDAWYRDVVASAYARDIVAGKAEDEFAPADNITRQEIAVIISRILVDRGFEDAERGALDKFSDKQEIADWARSGAALASSEGIVQGLPGGKFAPQKTANRAEAAVMVYRLYKKIN